MKSWKNIKRIGACMLAAVLCAGGLALTSLASDAPDMDRKGSIKLSLVDRTGGIDEPIEGAHASLYRIADRVPGEAAEYTILERYAGADIKLDQLSVVSEALKEAAKLKSFIMRSGIPADQMILTDQAGDARFENLPVGLYMLTSQNGGGYDIATPFFVGLPVKGSGGTSWLYEVQAAPKAQKIKGAVILNKFDQQGTRLPGAIFRLDTKEEGGTWTAYASNLTTDSAGQIVKTDLDYGEYRFIEQKAPDGYLLSANAYEFHISNYGDVSYQEGIWQAASSYTSVINVTNRRQRPAGDGPDDDGGGSGGGSSSGQPSTVITTQDVPLGTLKNITDDVSILLGQEVPLVRLPQTGQDIRRVLFFFLTGMGLVAYGWSDLHRERKGSKGEKK